MPGHTHPIPVLNKIVRSGSFVSRTKRVTQIYNPTLATREFSRKTKVTTTQARIRSSFVEKHSDQIISLGEKPCTQISRYIENISVTSPSASGCSLNWSNHRKRYPITVEGTFSQVAIASKLADFRVFHFRGRIDKPDENSGFGPRRQTVERFA